MTESEAIEKANKHVLEHRQINAKPIEVHCVRRPDSRAYWWISYGTAVYYPAETAAGAMIDDGAHILSVDDETGEVSVLQ